MERCMKSAECLSKGKDSVLKEITERSHCDHCIMFTTYCTECNH